MMIELKDDRYVIRLPKMVLILTKAEFIEALRRGKAWRRREAMAKPRNATNTASVMVNMSMGIQR
jgi:hypothetical protein